MVSWELANLAMPIAASAEELLEILPHRPPMLLIDHVPWIDGDHVVAVTRPLGLERTGVPRPGNGSVPEALLLEAVAQTIAAGVIVRGQAADPKKRGRAHPGVLAGISEFRFLGRVPIGAHLSIWTGVERVFRGQIVTSRAEAYLGATLVAEGRMTIAIGLPDQ